ncbi:MAG: YciI family protein [Planctomycetota bacterium]|nr:YciI family protein [Planctomycetota bacterium]
MRYLLLIHAAEESFNSLSEADRNAVLEGYGQFTQELQSAGAMLSAERLMDVATATTVRVQDGQVQATDGPFAETKEQLGGFYLIEAKDLDEAIAWAAKIPASSHGSVEVRPIWESPEQ